MNKKGFTLIEIIGAVIILGIIAIIAFATYSSSLTDFRENYYEGEVRTLEKSAKEFFDDNRNYRPTKILNAQEVQVKTLETQNYISSVKDYAGNSCSAKSYVLVIKEDTDKYSYHGCLICEEDGYDNTKDDIYCDRSWLDPTKVVYGIGELTDVYIYRGTTRAELKDELDLPLSYVRKDDNGNIIATKRGTKEGNETILPTNMDVVNTDVVGEYKVIYKYGEEEGTRKVIVYENQAPTIKYEKDQIVATGINGGTTHERNEYVGGTWAQNVIVTLNSNAYRDSSITTSRFQWNVDGKWQDFCNTDPCEKKVTRELNQEVQFRIVDSNGHISLTTEPITFKIDNTNPKCGVTIPTEIGENDWYKTDVTIQFSEKEDLKSSEDNSLVSGIKRYNIQKNTDTLVRDTTTNAVVHNYDTTSVTYIGYVEDEAENFATCTATTFRRDATKPNCTDSGDSTSYVKGSRTIYWGCDDPKSNEVNSECSPSTPGGNRVFDTTTVQATIDRYTIKDNAGNVRECPARTANVYVDNTAPNCNGVGSESSTISSVTATVGCTDGNSGCKSNPFKVTGQTTSGKLEIEDNVGNKQECSYEIYLKDQYKDCASYNTECTEYGTTTCCTSVTDYDTCLSYTYGSCIGYKWDCTAGSCFQDPNTYTSCYTNSSCTRVCNNYERTCNKYDTTESCSTCTDYNNCTATKNVSCNKWESDWHDASSCTPSDLDRQCQQVYRAK